MQVGTSNMYFDAHTHLNAEDLYPKRESLLDEFSKIGGKGLVNIGVNNEYNTKAIEIAQKVQLEKKWNDLIVKAAIGLHPGEVCYGNITEENIEQKVSEVKNLYKEHSEHIVAIGEIGIDTHYEGTIETINLQKKLFEDQCRWASDINMPIVIHSRSNFTATYDVLKNFAGLTIYFHCRGYDSNEINILLKTFPNLYVGFCGNISYKKAENIRRSIETLTKSGKDISRVLLETDAPYLSPQIVRSIKNKPAHISHLYDYVAQILEKEQKELKKSVEENFKKLYRV